MIDFETTPEDAELIAKIVQRARRTERYSSSTLAMEMDLTATHLNGCPLDLEKLLAFDDGNFAHDMGGIQRHLNRMTGELGGCFLPRCAKPEA